MGMQTTQRQRLPEGKTNGTAADANDSFTPRRAANLQPHAASPMAPPLPASRSKQDEQPERCPPPRFQHSFDHLKIFPNPAVADLTTPIVVDAATAHNSSLPRKNVGGEPAPHRTRMERAFGANFSAVQSFRGQSALLAPLGARAAAWPETIAFASTTPAPQVVAHELAHVLQYRNAPNDWPRARGMPARGDPAEVEAKRAASQIQAGLTPRLRARPTAAVMFYTDEEDLDSEEYLRERPPHFTDHKVGQWGQTLPATLVARERLDTSFPIAERSNAIVEAIFYHEPLVIMQEYRRLWLYRLEWEGLSARYSRFTNSSTLFSRAAEEAGGHAVSNVSGQPAVDAFVTEDGGVLSPPEAGTLFVHTGGEFEDPLVSSFENALAFIGGLETGLENADFAGLAEQLRHMAALNTVFPAPFALGAAHGIAREIIDLAQWLNPAQWQAVEAAARQTILMLSDPDGEELARAIGRELGSTQAAALDKLLKRNLVVFAYEVGKLVGPAVVEIVLGFIGIQVGPLALAHKTLNLVGEAPRLLGILRKAKGVFQEIPKRPGFGERVGKEIVDGPPSTRALPGVDESGVNTAVGSPLPDLSSSEQKLLATTGDLAEYPGSLPNDLANQELEIVKRSRKMPTKDSGDGYINEVDLGNGHKWKESLDGTWCRFSNNGTNCTRLVLALGAQPAATIVAMAQRRSLLREVYFEWAADRAADGVEVALAVHPKSRTYAVVVGDVGHVSLPHEGVGWVTIAHTHPGAPRQPGVINPSPRDLEVSLVGSFKKTGKRIRKWVHSQTADGTWQEVEYGLDIETGDYYVQPAGGEPIYFDELQDPALADSGVLYEVEELAEELRIQRMGELNSEEFYAGWWAKQFVWND